MIPIVLVGLGLIVFAAIAAAQNADTPMDAPMKTFETGVFSPKVVTLGQAISRIEGYGVPGAIGTIHNNPGNIFLGSQHAVYATATDGFSALYSMLRYIEQGKSKYYPYSMTFLEFGWMYVNGTKPSSDLIHPSDHPVQWADYVSKAVGFSVDDTLGDYFGG